MMEIPNDDPCQSSMLWRANKCHCQVPEFLLYFSIHEIKVHRILIRLFSCIHQNNQAANYIIPNLYPTIDSLRINEKGKYRRFSKWNNIYGFWTFFQFQGGKIMPSSCNRIFPLHLNIACNITGQAPFPFLLISILWV